jgi:hypothetical protein
MIPRSIISLKILLIKIMPRYELSHAALPNTDIIYIWGRIQYSMYTTMDPDLNIDYFQVNLSI